MSKQSNKFEIKSILNITLRLFIVCTIIAAVVAGVNALTADKIAQNERKVTEDTIRSVFTDGKIVNLNFGENESDDSSTSVTDIFKICNEKDDSLIGYSCICAPTGFGGEVKMMVAFDNNKVITSVRIMSHSETPGIGDKIVSAEYEQFREQFAGKNSNLEFGKDVDKISGSSKSSNAVLKGVNDAITVIAGIN